MQTKLVTQQLNVIPHQRTNSTNEIPQAANRVVDGVGIGGGSFSCVVGAELQTLCRVPNKWVQ
jgi:hypothetical protein